MGKVNFDRQIVAIAKVNGATMIYSDDDGLAKFAKSNGIQPVHTWQLPQPRWKQESLPLTGQQPFDSAVSREQEPEGDNEEH